MKALIIFSILIFSKLIYAAPSQCIATPASVMLSDSKTKLPDGSTLITNPRFELNGTTYYAGGFTGASGMNSDANQICRLFGYIKSTGNISIKDLMDAKNSGMFRINVSGDIDMITTYQKRSCAGLAQWYPCVYYSQIACY